MASENKMITLRSSDGELFEVEDIAAMESQTLRHLIEDGCADSSIPLPNVSAKTLSKIIEYCRIHVGLASVPAVASKALSTDGTSTSATKQSDEDLKNWDKEFIKVDLTTLYYLLLAANYLSIRGLLDLACQTVADMMKGKSPEEIRQIFNIKNDFTPEEEEQIRRENQWAFE